MMMSDAPVRKRFSLHVFFGPNVLDRCVSTRTRPKADSLLSQITQQSSGVKPSLSYNTQLPFFDRHNLLDRSVDIMNTSLTGQAAVLQIANEAVQSEYQSTGSFFGSDVRFETDFRTLICVCRDLVFPSRSQKAGADPPPLGQILSPGETSGEQEALTSNHAASRQRTDLLRRLPCIDCSRVMLPQLGKCALLRFLQPE
jgi:hypothetical protein